MTLDSLDIRLLAASAALAPALALLLYFSAHGNWRPLRQLVWIAFGLGFSAAIPIAGIAALYAPFIAEVDGIRLHALAVAFLEASLPEELGKYLVIFFFVLRHEDPRRPVDAIVLSVMVSLGFATIENLYYVFSSENWSETAMLRAITAVPMHATIGIIMGCYAARLTMERNTPWRIATPMLAWPILFHGMYDYPVFAVKSLAPAGGTTAEPDLLEFQSIFIFTIFVTGLFAVCAIRTIARMPGATEPIAHGTPSKGPV
ncbi:MAG: PrsW family glutamic-type intramembrane protease [Alphaproteobacteria bacterium]|nr:PrsW family glutamic-type intramembrane protease [Alphaproteobacteria bacterium]